jgi:hypothetical protein
MKKIFTSLILLALTLPVLALNSRLTISAANDNDVISVQVDGRNYQFNRSRNGNDIVIDDLRAGYHSVKVYKQNDNRRNNGRQGNSMKLIYNGNIYVRNGFHTDITINRFGKAFTDERQINRYGGYDDDNGYDDNDRDWDRDRDRQMMNARSFEQLKQSIRRENYDESKIAITKSAIRNQFISSNQVVELVGLFSFDASKLDIAKYLYHYAADPENYYVVANSFGFSSSKTELLRYIEQNRRR